MHVAALSHGIRPTDGHAPATPSYGADALSLAIPAHGLSTVLVWKRRRWSRRYHVDEDAPLPMTWMWVGERCEERAQGASRRSSTYKSGADEFERIRAMVMFATKTGEQVRKLPQEPLPFDLSGFDLTEFAAFAKKTAPDWVEGASREPGSKT